MSDKLEIGTRVKIDYHAHVGGKGTVVAHQKADNAYRVYLDDEDKVEIFFRSEMEVYVKPIVEMIHTREHLLAVKADLSVRSDWHEPDKYDVTVEVRGKSFDNAGTWGREDLRGKPHEKVHVVLLKKDEEVAMVNLATLFAWATGYEGQG